MIFPSKDVNLYSNSWLKKRPKTTENSVWNSLYREVYGENPFSKVPQHMCIYTSRFLSGQCFWINPESRVERTWTYFRRSKLRTRTIRRYQPDERSFNPARKNQFYAYLIQGSLDGPSRISVGQNGQRLHFENEFKLGHGSSNTDSDKVFFWPVGFGLVRGSLSWLTIHCSRNIWKIMAALMI